MAAIGFTANWYFGQNDAGLAIYVSPGIVNGFQVQGAVLPIPPDRNVLVWVTAGGAIQAGFAYPTNINVYPIAVVTSGKIITSTIARNGFFNTDEGIQAIVDNRPSDFFAFASSNLMGQVLGNSSMGANGSLNVPVGAQIQGSGSISALLFDTRSFMTASLAGTSVVLVILNGSLQVLSPLSGTLQGIGSVQAVTFDLSKSHAAILGQGTVSGTLVGKGGLVDSILGTSVTSRSNLNILVPVVSSISGTGSVSAVTFNSSASHVAIQGAGAVSDTLKGAGALSSSIHGNNLGTNTLLGAAPLIDSVIGKGSVSAVTFNSSASHAAITGAGSISDTLGGKGALASTIQGLGGTTITTTLSGSLRGFIAGLGVVSATMRITSTGSMSSTIQGHGVISAIGRAILPLTITNNSALPDDTINNPYSDTLVGSGGVAPYTWAVVAGTLPPGLSLNTSSGVISGTPTALGNFSFTIQITDSQ